MENQQYNYFDNLQAFDEKAAEEFQREQIAKGQRLDYLIHRTFAQTEAGQELLDIWKESLAMNSTAEPGQDMLQVGINEGMKRFIRNILLTIQRVESD